MTTETVTDRAERAMVAAELAATATHALTATAEMLARDMPTDPAARVDAMAATIRARVQAAQTVQLVRELADCVAELVDGEWT